MGKPATVVDPIAPMLGRDGRRLGAAGTGAGAGGTTGASAEDGEGDRTGEPDLAALAPPPQIPDYVQIATGKGGKQGKDKRED